jgi:hypothetical protein
MSAPSTPDGSLPGSAREGRSLSAAGATGEVENVLCAGPPRTGGTANGGWLGGAWPDWDHAGAASDPSLARGAASEECSAAAFAACAGGGVAASDELEAGSGSSAPVGRSAQAAGEDLGAEPSRAAGAVEGSVAMDSGSAFEPAADVAGA